jgi:hypothetical protein
MVARLIKKNVLVKDCLLEKFIAAKQQCKITLSIEKLLMQLVPLN